MGHPQHDQAIHHPWPHRVMSKRPWGPGRPRTLETSERIRPPTAADPVARRTRRRCAGRRTGGPPRDTNRRRKVSPLSGIERELSNTRALRPPPRELQLSTASRCARQHDSGGIGVLRKNFASIGPRLGGRRPGHHAEIEPASSRNVGTERAGQHPQVRRADFGGEFAGIRRMACHKPRCDRPLGSDGRACAQ